ncbi:MAG: DMT family transporter, partial [Myxococcota bacterium]|nr:DMT family transporter [Myxococcota bacterium]
MAGELAALAAAAFWAVASILWTRLGRESGAIALNFLKCAIAALLLAATMWVLSGQGWPADLPLPALLWLGLSGVAGLTIGDSAYFHALQHIGPRRTLLIWATSPAVSALLAWPILGEPIHRIMVLGMGLTLGGVTWVVLERSPAERNEPSLNRLRSTEEWVGIAYASVAVFGQAISNVLVKYGAQAGGDEVGALEASVIRLAIGALGVGIYLGALGRITETLV